MTCGHAARDGEAEVADVESVPLAGPLNRMGRRRFEDDVAGGEFAEEPRGGAGAGGRREPSLFARDQLGEPRPDGAEAELAVEPERAGGDAFLVLEAELVRVDREDRSAEQLPEESQ